MSLNESDGDEPSLLITILSIPFGIEVENWITDHFNDALKIHLEI
jgi:hypothetical protein